MVRRTMVLLSLFCAATAGGVLMLQGCSDDDSTATNAGDGGTEAAAEASTQDAPTASTGTLVVNAKWTGSGLGAVTIGVQGDDGSIAGFQQVPSPTWPGSNPITFKSIKAGHYSVGGWIDIGGNNPDGPGPEDPSGGGDVTVVAGQTATVDVDFQSPADDGGTDAPSDAPDDGG